jgi:hypothetical protein
VASRARTAARDLEDAPARDPVTRNIQFDFLGQAGLMRTTFSGLGFSLDPYRLTGTGLALSAAAIAPGASFG